MSEAEEYWPKYNTEPLPECLPLVLDESSCRLSDTNPIYKEIVRNNNPVEIINEFPKNENIYLTPSGHNSEFDIANKKLIANIKQKSIPSLFKNINVNRTIKLIPKLTL